MATARNEEKKKKSLLLLFAGFGPAEISFLIVLFSFIVLLPSLWAEIKFGFAFVDVCIVLRLFLHIPYIHTFFIFLSSVSRKECVRGETQSGEHGQTTKMPENIILMVLQLFGQFMWNIVIIFRLEFITHLQWLRLLTHWPTLGQPFK